MSESSALVGSRATAWLCAGAISATAIAVVRLERFPEWDEAVFLSQSGGLDGRPAPPSHLAASREIGSARFIGFLRDFTESLANTRLLWMISGVLLLWIGSILVSKWLRFPPGLLIIGFGSYWLSIIFMGTLQGFFLASTTLLIAAGCYLALRANEQEQIRWGVLLGLTLAASFWLRQVESAIVVGAFLLHAVIHSPTTLVRNRWRGLLVSLSVFIMLFVVPWYYDSIVRFGSLRARVDSARSQDFARGFSNQAIDYFAVLRGYSQHYSRHGPPPALATGVITVAFAMALIWCLVATVIGTSRTSGSREVGVAALSLMWLTAACSLGFFTFFIQEVSDRYMLIGMIFLLAGLGGPVWHALTALTTRGSGRAAVLVAAAVTWMITNASVAVTYESGRYQDGATVRTYGEALYDFAGDEACYGIARFGAPRVQFASGCSVGVAASLDEALERVDELSSLEAGLVFLWWPQGEREEVDASLPEWNQLLPPAPETQPYIVWRRFGR